ncbi:MAG: MFS transporter [Candidatus Roizmanbacteria bacterium]
MNSSLKEKIQKYYLFQFFDSLAFFAPVIVLFWQSNGLTVTQIMYLQSIYSIGVVFLELPTGAFADFFGKKQSLMIGALFWTGGIIFYGLGHTFWQFVIGELVVGIGSAFISGADRAYLHELLRMEQKTGDFKKIEGKARGIIQVAQAIGSIGGGLIGTISLGLPLISTGISTFIGFVIATTFPPVKKTNTRVKKPGYLQIIGESLSLIKRHKTLLWLTVFFACFNGLLLPLNFYSQLYMQVLKVPILYFGVILFGFNLITAFGSTMTHRFEKIAGKSVFIIMSVVVVSALLIIVLTQSIFTFILWSLFLTCMFMTQTIISDRVLQIVPVEKAATILSFQSLARRLTYAAVAPIVGMATDGFGIQKTLFGYALILALVFGVLLVLQNKFETAKVSA